MAQKSPDTKGKMLNIECQVAFEPPGISGKFNATVSMSHYASWDVVMVGKQLNGKDREGVGSGDFYKFPTPPTTLRRHLNV